MSAGSRRLAAYVRQVAGADRAFGGLVVGFFLAFREEFGQDVRLDDAAALLSAICRCLDLDPPTAGG